MTEGQHRIEYLDTGALTPYARNSRTHTDEQVRQIAASISEFGFTNPVLIDGDGGIIAGHGRVMAASTLGMATVPCIRLAHLSDQQRRAYVIADNQLALNAGWDDDILRSELQLLQDDAFDIDILGFDDRDLDALLQEDDDDGGGENNAPQPAQFTVSRPGDIWIMGAHRLACGDSTDSDSVGALLSGAEPHLMVTDPPYGVEYDPAWRQAAGVNKSTGKLGSVANDDIADWSAAWALFHGVVAYVWHGALHAALVQRSLESCGLGLRAVIVWAKDRMALSRGHYHRQTEHCFYMVRDGSAAHWSGARDQTTLWHINSREDSGHGHGTQKPVECMRRPMLNNRKRGDAVYEPFSGSGTTIIAAETTGRACYAMELLPEYVDIAIRRWQAHTGLDAVHEQSGETFSQRGGEQ